MGAATFLDEADVTDRVLGCVKSFEKVDPTKVVRVALENAVSVASVLLLTEATMTEIPEKEAKHPAETEMGL